MPDSDGIGRNIFHSIPATPYVIAVEQTDESLEGTGDPGHPRSGRGVRGVVP
jgi:hypothetical protein